MALSAKQLGMAWVNSKLDPKKINPEEEELQVLNGGKPISEKVLADAIAFIHEDLAKLKVRYQSYAEKYCTVEGASNGVDEENSELPDSVPAQG